MSTEQHVPRPARRVRPWNTAFGLAFLAVAGTWAALEHDVVEGYEIGRLLAWGLIALGVVGIAGTVLVTRRDRVTSAAHPTVSRDDSRATDDDTSTSTEGDDDHEHA